MRNTYQFSDELGFSFKTNLDGLRVNAKIFKEVNIDNSYKVGFFGDSFVFGYGVDYENSLPHLLESKLINGGLNAQVYNFGVPGSDQFSTIIYSIKLILKIILI